MYTLHSIVHKYFDEKKFISKTDIYFIDLPSYLLVAKQKKEQIITNKQRKNKF